MIKEHVEIMHLARSKAQLKALWKVVKVVWVEAGEGAMADWFGDEYVTEDWATWFVCGSEICGVPSNSQPVESEHNLIKKIKMDFLRSPMRYLFQKGFLDLLRRALQFNQTTVLITNDCDPDKIPRQILFAAKLFLELLPAPRQKLMNYKMYLSLSLSPPNHPR